MSEIELHETMRAVMKPDIYAGPKCEDVKPRWYASAEGDKGDGDIQYGPLELAAETFPPGTRVLVMEPMCPGCREPRYPVLHEPENGTVYSGKCDCGFDWDQWVQNEFA